MQRAVSYVGMRDLGPAIEPSSCTNDSKYLSPAATCGSCAVRPFLSSASVATAVSPGPICLLYEPSGACPFDLRNSIPLATALSMAAGSAPSSAIARERVAASVTANAKKIIAPLRMGGLQEIECR